MSEQTPDSLGKRVSDNSENVTGLPSFLELGNKNIYVTNEEMFQEHFKDQYLMYVEMADRISARRHQSNVFFLSLQSVIITLLSLSFKEGKNQYIMSIIPITSFSMVFICVAWWWILRSYRNLNSAKYKVIGRMEESMPASPYWKEEWKELGEGKDFRKYLQLTFIEQFLPVIFGIMYIALAVSILWLTAK